MAATLDGIDWPPDERPEQAIVFAHNEVLIPAPADDVWSWLIDAPNWPKWYRNSRDVELPAGAASLDLGMTFRWTTFFMPITSRVLEFEAPIHLGWHWWRSGARGYHGWLLQPRSDGQTRVITEETQFGLLPWLGRPLMRRALHHEHQQWLVHLVTQAELGRDPNVMGTGPGGTG